MIEPNDNSGITAGGEGFSSLAWVRQRYLAAWEEALRGQTPPDIDNFLKLVPESERAALREELEALARGYSERPRAAGSTNRPAGGDTARASVAADGPGAPAITIDLPPGSAPDPNQTTDRAPDLTVDEPAAPSATSDSVGAEKVWPELPSSLPQGPTYVGGKPPAKTADPAALPKRVAGYEILGVLGRGAMGVVYKARQSGLNRLVALKMILSGDHAAEHEIARFKAEAEAVAQIQHVNIVQIYEVGEEAGRPYFSLEFVDGGSLDKKIAGNPQPPREAAQLVHLLAAAMDVAHQKGIIHRDLKPANVLIARDGTPKISDFGLAKKLEGASGQTQSGAILGTPNYMAPEQALGKLDDIGPVSDVYALGVILYELLTGRVPFRGTNMIETLKQVATREPVAPSALQDKIPRDLETICLKCLQKDRTRRYATAGALAEDLRRFLNLEPILARPVGRAERAWRWCRRNPLGAAAIAGVAVWAVTMSLLAWRLQVQKSATEAARTEAVKNQHEAEHQTEVAQANEADAKAKGKVARERHEKAVITVAKLVEEMLKRLQSRVIMTNAAPEVRGLRDQMVKMSREQMMLLAKELEDVDATSFGRLEAHQLVGDVLRHLGQGQEALGHFKQGADLARKIADEEPNSDKARGNLSVMVTRLGDMERELRGDPRAARAHYEEALRLRRDIIDHPRSGDFTALDHTIALSHLELRLGQTDLDVGDPSAARGHFQTCMEQRRRWSAAKPELDEGRSYLAEAWMWLGVCGWHLRDESAVRDGFGQSVALCDVLIKKHPNAFWFKADLAEIQGYRGDAWLRSGKTNEAKASFDESLANLQAALTRQPDETAFRAALAMTEARLARFSNAPDDARKHDEVALRIYAELLQIEPNNLAWQGAFARQLARCGKPVDAASKADALLRTNPSSPVLLLESARCYAACSAADPAAKTKFADKAIGAVRTLTAGGFKDRAALASDPDLVPLRSDPGFQALAADPALKPG
jgi:serine/threonine-protein kinase